MASVSELSAILSKLEELGKKADETNLKVDQANRRIEEIQSSVHHLTEEQDLVKAWKPELEGKVTELQNSVSDLKLKVDLFIHELPSKPKGEEEIKLEASTPAYLGVPAKVETSGQSGHREETLHRSAGFGVVTTLEPPPVKGAKRFSETTHVPFRSLDSPGSVNTNGSGNFAYTVPKSDFPSFDGSNPKIWIKHCENFFDVYDIPDGMKVKFALMNFLGSAAFWMQSIEVNLRTLSWEELCKSVVTRFERDQHNQIVRQFFHLRQTTSVAEYVELFDELVHQLLAHDPYVSPVVITNKFVDGLKPEIKVVVLVHRPKDLDSASSLALLQEEVLLGHPNTNWRRNDEVAGGNMVKKDEFALSKQDQVGASTYSPMKNQPYGGENRKNTGGPKSKSQDERLAALMAYRKAKGLCFKCGLKWGSTHKCPDSVSLNVVEELWQMLGVSDVQDSKPEDSDSGDDLLEISTEAATGVSGSKTLKLKCHVSCHTAIALVDSGSSHNFISELFASQLPNWKALKEPIKVRVANGNLLLCTHQIENCAWLVQGVQFQTSFNILPLKCYDVILGMNWLEQHSPMEIQWAQKWLSFQYQGRPVKLQGLNPRLDKSPQISYEHLCSLQDQDDIWCTVQINSAESQQQGTSTLPAFVQALVDSYGDLFAEPSGLPPSRAFDHTIPLLLGTQPFRLWPYRYTPAQKDEIEKQVAQLLSHNMIKESSSPFASPVLLVKKKTGEWRLCVDFRRLNAHTIKNKFPLPIIEELFEELLGAKWFTTLDLRSGFHQILVATEDQCKTAFQTHLGHYEYKVMPYGLTGAPATFQAVMNHILKPLLRKCVVVFIDDILIYSKSLEEHVEHVKMVFDILREHQFKVRLSKCSFSQQELAYLGHVLSSAGVATDPSKLSIVENWPVPLSVRELRSFLGMVGYYRRFVKNFGLIAKPLTELLKKGQLLFGPQFMKSPSMLLRRH